MSKLVDGKRQAPKLMGPVVNTGKWTAHPFLAPDESYLIWDSEREGGFGKLFNRGVDADNENVDIYWVDAKVIEELRP